jgi:glutamate synthase (NADPH/NADH) small chain
MGYTVTVFEKNEAAGGLLRYGIPNFKLNKAVIDRRIKLLEHEGIEFRYGEAVDPGNLGDSKMSYDAYIIATGTPTARDLNAPGRELKGVHFALELLSQQNRVLAGIDFSQKEDSGKYVCSVCGYLYDPAEHDGVAFEDLPDDWRCPRCKQPKEKFNKA